MKRLSLFFLVSLFFIDLSAQTLGGEITRRTKSNNNLNKNQQNDVRSSNTSKNGLPRCIYNITLGVSSIEEVFSFFNNKGMSFSASKDIINDNIILVKGERPITYKGVMWSSINFSLYKGKVYQIEFSKEDYNPDGLSFESDYNRLKSDYMKQYSKYVSPFFSSSCAVFKDGYTNLMLCKAYVIFDGKNYRDQNNIQLSFIDAIIVKEMLK